MADMEQEKIKLEENLKQIAARESGKDTLVIIE
jgi:hypothetical protein